MRITILSDSFPPISLGGAEVVASNLSHLLVDRGNDVSVITTTKNRKNIGTTKEEGLTVYRIYSDYNMRWRAYESLYNRRVLKEVEVILKVLKPDIVHAHNVHEHLSYASLKIAKRYSKAVFLTFHDVMAVHYGKLGAKLDSKGKVVPDSIGPLRQLMQYKFYYNPFRNIVIKYYLKYIDKFFAVSEALKDFLEKRGINQIEVIHNGINISDWIIDENKLMVFRKNNNLEGKKVLFFGGRLSSAKGGNVVLDVLKEVSVKIDNVVLLVAGNKNKSVEEMVKKAENLGISDKIIFAGWITHNDIRYAYSASDVVLVLSQYIDPFPTVNLEAMACKKPVIGTCFGGTSEIVVNNETGYIVNPSDTRVISDKVFDLLKDEEKSKSFGLAGFERVSKSFSEDSWASEILSRYDTIIQNNK